MCQTLSHIHGGPVATLTTVGSDDIYPIIVIE